MFEDNTPLEVQVEALASFIMKHFPQYILGDGAIGTAIIIMTTILESSNGRTDDSESSNGGSNPSLRTYRNPYDILYDNRWAD